MLGITPAAASHPLWEPTVAGESPPVAASHPLWPWVVPRGDGTDPLKGRQPPTGGPGGLATVDRTAGAPGHHPLWRAPSSTGALYGWLWRLAWSPTASPSPPGRPKVPPHIPCGDVLDRIWYFRVRRRENIFRKIHFGGRGGGQNAKATHELAAPAADPPQRRPLGILCFRMRSFSWSSPFFRRPSRWRDIAVPRFYLPCTPSLQPATGCPHSRDLNHSVEVIKGF
jgi:hypothetical protein